MPSMSPITAIGIHCASSVTNSHSPRGETASSSSVVSLRSIGSCAATRRGVKPRFTRLRRRLCCGSSRLIIDGIHESRSGRELLLEQNTSGCRETSMMSS
jgi:hypothetical protein